MEFTNIYTKLHQEFLTIRNCYVELYENKFALEEAIKTHKLYFIDSESNLSDFEIKMIKTNLIMVHEKIRKLPSSMFKVSDLKMTMFHMQNLLSTYLRVNKINTATMKDIDKVSNFSEFLKKLRSIYNNFTSILYHLNSFDTREVLKFQNRIKKYEIPDYVKNDMILYNKCKNILKDTPNVIENDFSTINNFLEFQYHIIDLESQINDKKETIDYYINRKNDTIKMYNILKNEKC